MSPGFSRWSGNFSPRSKKKSNLLYHFINVTRNTSRSSTWNVISHKSDMRDTSKTPFSQFLNHYRTSWCRLYDANITIGLFTFSFLFLSLIVPSTCSKFSQSCLQSQVVGLRSSFLYSLFDRDLLVFLFALFKILWVSRFGKSGHVPR